jgi:malonyl-CoA O-methyltransferase
MNTKEIIKRNFSRYAGHYDDYSNIQDASAKRLIEELGPDSVTSILDVGCGTGNYTRLLRERFPLAKIKAIDISGEMVETAKVKLKGKGIEFAVKDAEELELSEESDSTETFDLITSNVSFQWFAGLEKALLDYKDRLKPGGTILFSTFGPLTFYELNDALKELSEEADEISSRRFLEKMKITKIMKSLFKKIEVREEAFKENYASLREFLKKIKYSGTRGNGTGTKSFWVSEKIDNLERIYRKKFNEIVATYQVYICKGVK